MNNKPLDWRGTVLLVKLDMANLIFAIPLVTVPSNTLLINDHTKESGCHHFNGLNQIFLKAVHYRKFMSVFIQFKKKSKQRRNGPVKNIKG